ncbi:UNVERIFIED_CONTAM: hypothetical protein GTU68_016002, partial [Idotea baltica]|nr:hypothetical protein [Idotea baltica]
MLEILEPGTLEVKDGLLPLLKASEHTADPKERQTVADSPAKTLQIPTSDALSITFDQVSFDYEPGRPALSQLSFEIKANDNIAIVGPSGAGKSTLMSLLLGFIYPQSGEIRVNGSPLQPHNIDQWREQLVWMPQRAHLFHGTIRENISLGVPDADEQAIKAAATFAQISETIEALPDQYNTQVGERGAGFSGGQIQRIALARAFIKDAPVMLLDEPTAHLDEDSEFRLQQSL